MEFVAIDVETANPDMASICQIGIAIYKDSKLIYTWDSLINPQDYFDDINVSIHGINEHAVTNAPTLPQVAHLLKNHLNNKICVCHTHFDRVSMTKAYSKHHIDNISITWLDTAKIARRTWKDVAQRGYGLANLCHKIDYNFTHHNALEDAKAAANILFAAIEKSGIKIEGWIERTNQPIDNTYKSHSSAINKEGNPEGNLYGETVVFTGILQLSRKDAAIAAAKAGCVVRSSVTKNTTLLVAGVPNFSRIKNKSSKHAKAEQLILEGQKIKIINELDFEELIKN